MEPVVPLAEGFRLLVTEVDSESAEGFRSLVTEVDSESAEGFPLLVMGAVSGDLALAEEYLLLMAAAGAHSEDLESQSVAETE